MTKPASPMARARSAQARLDEQFEAVAGRRILDRGSGPTVVFVPTFHQLAFVYQPLIEALAATYRVVTYEPAVSATALFGPDERAAELQDMLDVLSADAAHLVAWSDAGTVVSEYVRQHPGRVASRVYLHTAAQYVLPFGLRRAAGVYTSTGLSRLTPNIVASLLVAGLMGGRMMPTRSLLRDVHGTGATAGYLRYSILPCLQRSNVVTAACPSLVVGGSRDRFVRPEHMQKLAQGIGCRYVVVDGGDHFLPWTRPNDVTRMVSEFLDGATTERSHP